jgi:chemotaxis protein MotB
MARGRREQRHSVDIWPGFVDALSTLLLAIIFMLVVFVLSQFFLGQLLQGRDEAMVRLEERLRDLATELDLERGEASDLRRSLAQVSGDLQVALGDRDEMTALLEDQRSEAAMLEERLARTEAARLGLERAIEESRFQAGDAEAAAERLRRELEAAREMITADRERIEAQLADLVRLGRDIEALQTVKGELERDIAELATSSRATSEERDRLLEELGSARDRSQALAGELASAEERTMLAQRELAEREVRLEELRRSVAALGAERDREADERTTAEARAERLAGQLDALLMQLSALNQLLDARAAEIDEKNLQIEDLGQRLNLALASEVEELSRYRSDFFGKLRRVLGDREDVQIVGDRFVFQSEVLFASAEAEIEAAGQVRLATLAEALREITEDIPNDLPWVLQVDGHTDRRPIRTPRFPSNWELSTARAISVAQFLVKEGLPADRVAARGFAEFQPLDPAETEEAYRRNRRIEIKLTTR